MDASVCIAILVPSGLVILIIVWFASEFFAGRSVRIGLGLLGFLAAIAATCWAIHWSFTWHNEAMSGLDAISLARDYLQEGRAAEAKQHMDAYLSSRGR